MTTDAEPSLFEKIAALTPLQLTALQVFVDEIATGDDDRAIARAWAAVSIPAFAAIWDNEDDSIYDAREPT